MSEGIVDQKVCSKCAEQKNIDEFFKAKKGYLGRRAECKKCAGKAQKKRQANWSEERLEAYKAQYTAKNAVKTSEDYRKDTLSRYYKMTIEDYDLMLEAQDGKCAICRRPQEDFVKTFAVDHDHSCCPGTKSCGKCIRGLLCGPCNQAIGLLQDSPNVIMDAATYVLSFKGGES